VVVITEPGHYKNTAYVSHTTVELGDAPEARDTLGHRVVEDEDGGKKGRCGVSADGGRACVTGVKAGNGHANLGGIEAP
jgi:hypothetical protein